jgi:hypothetical protein
MNDRVDQVLLEAMQLAPAERSMVALSLLDSLQGGADGEDAVVASWIEEARLRHDDLVSGRVQGMTADGFSSWFKSL